MVSGTLRGVAAGGAVKCRSSFHWFVSLHCPKFECNDNYTFRDCLSEQMLVHDPMAWNYPGDHAMRMSTAQNETQRSKSSGKGSTTPLGFLLNTHTMKEAKRPHSGRLCGDLSKFQNHVDSIKSIKNGKTCEMCGEKSYSVCMECDGKAVHFFPQKGPAAEKNCMIDLHNDLCFGLARSDRDELFGKRKVDWSTPTNNQKKLHARFVRGSPNTAT